MGCSYRGQGGLSVPRRLERVRNVPLWSTQPWFDPDNAPLNTAALFVGVAASLESLGRAGGEPKAAMEARRAAATELFAALATAPGAAVRDDVFSVCVKYCARRSPRTPAVPQPSRAPSQRAPAWQTTSTRSALAT